MRRLIFRLSVGLLTFAFGLSLTSWFCRPYSQIATPPPVIIPDGWKKIDVTDFSFSAPVELHIPIQAFSQSELVSTVKKKIGPQGPTYVFKLYSIQALSNYHYRIDVCDEGERIVLQSQDIRNGVRLESKPKSFQIVDVNSDNYVDIKVLAGYSNGRAWYKIGLYDPDRQEYVWVTETHSKVWRHLTTHSAGAESARIHSQGLNASFNSSSLVNSGARRAYVHCSPTLLKSCDRI